MIKVVILVILVFPHFLVFPQPGIRLSPSESILSLYIWDFHPILSNLSSVVAQTDLDVRVILLEEG